MSLEGFSSCSAVVEVAGKDKLVPIFNDFLSAKDYHPYVEAVEIVGDKKKGVGATRRLTYNNGITFLETMVEEHVSEYQKVEIKEHPFPVKEMFATKTLEKGNIVKFSIHFIANSKIYDFILKRKIQGLVNELTANFKVFVETGKTCEKKGRNLSYEPSPKKRVDKLVMLSVVPVLICFLAFTRSLIYRFWEIGDKFVGFGNAEFKIEKKCEGYGWLNNASFKLTCDNRPLDIHALAALAWLFVFAVQVFFIGFRNLSNVFRISHKTIGWLGFGIAIVNIFGMIQLATVDLLYPMMSNRPPAFTPFMWMVAYSTFSCTKASYDALKRKEYDMHAMWMFRAFIETFSTPVIRFYPLVLRYFFGTECVKQNDKKIVLAAATIALAVVTVYHYQANKMFFKQPIDSFMKIALMKVFVLFLVEAHNVFTKGFFITAVVQCAMMGHENYAAAISGEL